MSGVQMSAVRAQGGKEREAMRSFPALPADHPCIGAECAVCGEPFVVGSTTAIIPLGPGADEEAQAKALRGGWYSCLGVIAHDDCAGLMTNAPSAADSPSDEHRGEGGDEHRETTDTQDWPEHVVAAWCERIDLLLLDEPEVGAHRERNMAGDFPFSPATCALCRGLADIELAAARDVGAIERDPTAASGSEAS